MLLCKGVNFMRFYFVTVFVLTFVCCNHADTRSSNKTIKAMIIQEIMKKVSNLTINALSKAPHEKKEDILNKIENKLRKSAKSMGPDAEKYIKYIMEEFRRKTFNKNKNHDKTASEIIRKSVHVRTKEVPTLRIGIDKEGKKEVIKEIASKIEFLAKSYLKDAKTPEGKKQVLEKIKKRIMDSAMQKHIMLHNRHDELKTYSNLIARGLDLSIQKLLGQEIDGRRMVIKSLKDINEPTTENQKRETKKEDPVNDVESNIEEINKYKKLISHSLNDTSIDPRCNDIIEDTCLSIQSFNKYSCDDHKSIPIVYLCNGVVDCLDKSDENNCTAKAMEKIRKAAAVMTDIEASINRKCFASTNTYLLSSHNQILRDLLKTEMEMIVKKIPANPKPSDSATEKPNENEVFILKRVNDVNAILSTLSYALDGTLCAHTKIDPDQYFTDFRKFNDQFDDLVERPRDLGWSPKSCSCKGQYCKNPQCEATCKRICWERYSLNHWGCQALNSATSVSLDTICDGKLDCFDETDESQCTSDIVSSKFGAIKKYNILLELLTEKSKSYEYQRSRNKVLAVHSLVRQLQKQTVKTNYDSHIIKSLRDECFLQLVSIYDDFMQTASLDELDEHYLTLLSINEKLIQALKLSHTGNEKIISPEGCYCRDGLCALRRCSKNCIHACLAEPLLTRYSCNVTNMTIPVDAICNGKDNCPNGEDEKDCIKDVCRGHHLVLLRHNLKNIGVKDKSFVMAEVLESWKSKVSAAIYVAESTERPNHKIMVEVVNRVLKDLVMAFASMEEFKRSSSEHALKEFEAISKTVMQALKTCAY
ncbi:unnamed protein product [Spodoptera littoralis]|uniref:Uncharacterized protein n=1 Tax=Spodoptera littoralis TaxID=7109 RepID=A0A9P0MWC9_SPOLI|nr:unnamed protein product [Spodoptera littoralis]CAH1635806.1 unnamed protein product [Spodoptera littoralis]